MMVARVATHVAAVLLAAASIVPAHGQADPAFPFDLPPDVVAMDDVLPKGRSICSKLGLDPRVPGRCNAFAVLAQSVKQTDRSLWFSKTSTGAGPTCLGAIGFSRFRSGGTVTYLCPAPRRDVTITAEELTRLTAEVTRLNAVQHKTLAEHLRATNLKSEIDCMTGRQTEDCD